MGVFSRLLRLPEPDRSGRSRDYFDMAARTAVKMARRGDIPRAIRHMDIFLTKIGSLFVYSHPDIGRGRLLKAALLYLAGDLPSAATESQAAYDILKMHDFCNFDIQAAEDFQLTLKSTVAATVGVAGHSEPPQHSMFERWIARLES
jgi:hypothetical protein